MQVLHQRSACKICAYVNTEMRQIQGAAKPRAAIVRHSRFLAMLLLTLQCLTKEDGILLWGPCLHYPAGDDLGGDLWVLCPHGYQALLLQNTVNKALSRAQDVAHRQVATICFEAALPGAQVQWQWTGLWQGS